MAYKAGSASPVNHHTDLRTAVVFRLGQPASVRPENFTAEMRLLWHTLHMPTIHEIAPLVRLLAAELAIELELCLQKDTRVALLN